MTADSNLPEPARPGHPSRRACWCGTDKAKYGCYPCTDIPTPLEGDRMIPCRTCARLTRNNRDQCCDPCTITFASMEAQVDTRPVRWLVKRLWLREAVSS